jgi:hypothetical protein
MKISHSIPVSLAIPVFISCSQPPQEISDDWQLGPFVKVDAANPVLTPLSDTEFYCPVRQQTVRWEEKDVFNPAAINIGRKMWSVNTTEPAESAWLPATTA